MTRSTPNAKFGIVDPEVATRNSGLAFLQKLLDETYPSPPFAEACDLWPVEVAHGRIAFEGRPSRRFYNPMGIVHGGWISTLLDTAMACAVHSTLAPRQSYTTVEMKINFVRPLLEQTGVVRCEANVVHSGGRIATSQGRLIDASDRLIAHGSETCMVLEPRRNADGQPA